MVDIEDILQGLTLADKVKLVSGASAWRTHPVESAGIPVLKVSDGPNGVRGDGGVSAASFPVGVCMASTWNTSCWVAWASGSLIVSIMAGSSAGLGSRSARTGEILPLRVSSR